MQCSRNLVSSKSLLLRSAVILTDRLESSEVLTCREMELTPMPAYLRGCRSSSGLGNIHATRPRTPTVETGILTRPLRARRTSITSCIDLSNIQEISECSNESFKVLPAVTIPNPLLSTQLPSKTQGSTTQGRRRSMSDIYMTTLPQPSTTPSLALTRRGSHFTRRASAFPEKVDNCPSSLRLFKFYKELKTVCSLKPAVECRFNCFENGETTNGDGDSFAAGLDLIQQGQEGATDEVQFQLYLKEIRRINPTLQEGTLFVDGLYELVCSRLPLCQESPLKKSVTDLLTIHNSKTQLLLKYWRRPDDQSEHSAYLAVASSFVQYVLNTYGPRGVSQFLQKLDCSIVDPQSKNFTFKGKDLTSLEFKWIKFTEANANEEFHLSLLGMLRVLFRKYLLHHWLSLLIILLILLLDIGATLGLAISTAKVITLGQTMFSAEINQSNASSIESRFSIDTLFLLQWGGVTLALILVRFALVAMTTGLQAHVAVCVCKKIRRKLSARLQQVGPRFLHNYSSSAVISTFLQDVNVIEKLMAHSLRNVILGILTLITFVGYTMALIWQLALPLTMVYLSAQALVGLITGKFSEHSFAKSQATAKLCNIVKEQIDGYQISRLYGLGEFWKNHFDHVLHTQFSNKARRSLFLERFIQLFQLTVPGIMSSLVTFSLVLLLRFEFLNFENALSVLVFFNYVLVRVVGAAGDFPTLQNGTLALQRINAMLYNEQHSLHRDTFEQKVPTQKQNSQLSAAIIPGSLSVELRDVCFCYNSTASHWNLFDVNLNIKAGERIAVVGKSGAGKSSLLNLILQTYEPNHGEVVFGGDGTEFEGLKVAATFQFNHIFNMSIRENIHLGNLQATDTEIEEAAKLADLHVWVSTLSRGYDTAVSSGGSSLSGGQKQRIAIARMLVAKAPILVLDEVTSALDPATENKVFNKLMEITQGKTVVAATHRLEQAKEFDRIVVLSHGRIKELGTHEELIAQKGAYWCMWSKTEMKSPEKEKAIPIFCPRSWISSEKQDLSPALFSNTTPRLIIPTNVSKSQPNLTPRSFQDTEDPIPRVTSTPRVCTKTAFTKEGRMQEQCVSPSTHDHISAELSIIPVLDQMQEQVTVNHSSPEQLGQEKMDCLIDQEHMGMNDFTLEQMYQEQLRLQSAEQLSYEKVKDQLAEQLGQEKVKDQSGEQLSQRKVKDQSGEQLGREKVKDQLGEQLGQEKVKDQSGEQLGREKVKNQSVEQLGLEKVKDQSGEQLGQEKVKDQSAEQIALFMGLSAELSEDYSKEKWHTCESDLSLPYYCV